MEANYHELYSELRKTKEELQVKLYTCTAIPATVQYFIQEEIRDIETALYKILTGSYGRCENSGELIPKEILEQVPTIKTNKDMECISHFFRKTFY